MSSIPSEIITPFVELLYAKKLKVADSNPLFFAKALQVKNNFPSNNTWRCNTYSSIGTDYDLTKDELFKELIEECKNCVSEFATQYGVNNKTVSVTGAWINVANKGAYQEYHMHTNSHFSVCYYINTPENCGNIVFKSHESDKDMFALPAADSLTPPAFKTYWHSAVAGNVVIFRSNLAHMVELNQSEEPRVGISMNFVLE